MIAKRLEIGAMLSSLDVAIGSLLPHHRPVLKEETPHLYGSSSCTLQILHVNYAGTRQRAENFEAAPFAISPAEGG